MGYDGGEGEVCGGTSSLSSERVATRTGTGCIRLSRAHQRRVEHEGEGDLVDAYSKHSAEEGSDGIFVSPRPLKS